MEAQNHMSTPNDPADAAKGFNEFTIRDNRFYLNRSPFYAKIAALNAKQTPVEHLKALGFNTLLLDHEQTDLLDAAAQSGLVAWLRGPVAKLDSLASMLQDHPALAAWIAILPPESARPERAAELVESLRQHDPHRVVFVAYEANGKTHCHYNLPGEPLRTMNWLHVPLYSPISTTEERILQHVGTPEALTLVDFGGEPIRAAMQTIESHPEIDTDALEAARRSLSVRMDASRANAHLAGYIAPAALMPAPDDASAIDFARVQAPVRPLIQLAQSGLRPRQETAVTVMLANEAQLDDRVDLSLQVIGPTNQVLWKKKRSVKLPRHRKLLWEGSIAASGAAGPHRFVVTLLQGITRLGEASRTFYVLEPPARRAVDVHVLDPSGEWTPRLEPWVHPVEQSQSAPIHLVPPLANTVRVYPDNDLAHVLGQVHEGAVAVVFSPPSDWNDFAERIDDALTATPVAAPAPETIRVQYARLHPVLDGLPAGHYIDAALRPVAALETFAEAGDEDIAGAADLTSDGHPMADSRSILVRRYGRGRIVFVALRVLRHLQHDQAAARLFANLMQHFARRSIASSASIPGQQAMAEWLRRERGERARRWMVAGPINTLDKKVVVPDPAAIDLKVGLQGVLGPVTWRPWHTVAAREHRLDWNAALGAEQYALLHADVFAYTEFMCDARAEVDFHLTFNQAIKVWLNGEKVLETQAPTGEKSHESFRAFIKHGRNTLLMQITKTPGSAFFDLEVELPERPPIHLAWWR